MCPLCGKSVRFNQQAILCNICDRWCHRGYTCLTSAQYARLSSLMEPGYCSLCLGSILPFKSLTDDELHDTFLDQPTFLAPPFNDRLLIKRKSLNGLTEDRNLS